MEALGLEQWKPYAWSNGSSRLGAMEALGLEILEHEFRELYPRAAICWRLCSSG